jgi:hypothetical protein
MVTACGGSFARANPDSGNSAPALNSPRFFTLRQSTLQQFFGALTLIMTAEGAYSTAFCDGVEKRTAPNPVMGLWTSCTRLKIQQI